MREFNIEDMQDVEDVDTTIPVEKALTGDYIKGLSSTSKLEPTAELEGDEQVKTPDESVMKVVGKSHEEGGEKVALPDNTRVLSKTSKLTADQAKRLSKQYDINVDKKDDYARAVDMYNKKIGMEALSKEQEGVLLKLKNLFNNEQMDAKTKTVNQRYLAGEIARIETLKAPLEAKKAAFFDRVYDMQESVKTIDQKGNVFKYGGLTIDKIQEMADMYGVSVEKIRETIEKLVPKYDGGGKIKASARDNAFSNERVEPQSANQSTYGTEKSPEEIIQNLYNNFPDIVAKDEVFGKYLDKEALATGKVKLVGKLPMNKQLDVVQKFQEEANKRMLSSAEDIIKNQELFDEDTFKLATEYKKTQTFSGEKKKDGTTEEQVRSFDKMMGNFTSGRYSLGLSLLTPEEQTRLVGMGVTTLNQITPEIQKDLSPETIDRITSVQKIKGANSDFFLDTHVPEGEAPADVVDPIVAPDTTPKPDPNAGLVDRVVVPAPKYNSKLFYTPDQSNMPPSPLSVGSMVDTQFQRIDPIKIGIDENLQQAATSMQFASAQLDSLPPAQRAAALASMYASSQEGINKSIVEASRINAQNESTAENFNITQSNNETVARGQNILSYEERAFVAKDKTEQEIRNWMDHNKAVDLNNFRNQQRLNLMDATTPDYSIDFMGTGVSYDPSYSHQVYNPLQNSTHPDDDYATLLKQQENLNARVALAQKRAAEQK